MYLDQEYVKVFRSNGAAIQIIVFGGLGLIFLSLFLLFNWCHDPNNWLKQECKLFKKEKL